MKPLHAYQQPTTAAMPRIDVILQIYDEILRRLTKALDLLTVQPDLARELIAPCQVALGTLANSMALEQHPGADNFVRLYEFALHRLAGNSARDITDALAVLKTLQEGFDNARSQALELERQGHIPPLSQSRIALTA